ncbi:MAG: hypothetical protein GY859_27095, partial [Desulfobacterales bacterium]|nr:hypothetical protein [Desulfobacterales bacterium]
MLGACFGIEFKTRDLSVIAARSKNHVHQMLERAAMAGMITRRDGSRRFIHDKVLEAAYSLTPEERKPHKHLEIGRLLLSNTPGEELDNAVFQIVGHLNKGKEIITDAREKSRLARLNLKAGKKAKASAAYEIALHHVAIGVELIDEQSWDHDYQTTLELHAELAECSYINGNIRVAERYFTTTLTRSRTPIQKAGIYNIMALLHYSKADMAKSLQSGVAGLEVLGVRFPGDKEEKAATLENR